MTLASKSLIFAVCLGSTVLSGQIVLEPPGTTPISVSPVALLAPEPVALSLSPTVLSWPGPVSVTLESSALVAPEPVALSLIPLALSPSVTPLPDLWVPATLSPEQATLYVRLLALPEGKFYSGTWMEQSRQRQLAAALRGEAEPAVVAQLEGVYGE